MNSKRLSISDKISAYDNIDIDADRDVLYSTYPNINRLVLWLLESKDHCSLGESLVAVRSNRVKDDELFNMDEPARFWIAAYQMAYEGPPEDPNIWKAISPKLPRLIDLDKWCEKNFKSFIKKYKV